MAPNGHSSPSAPHSPTNSHTRKSSSGSRSTSTAVSSMPVITEDEAMPQKPLRVPPRSSRRGLPPEYIPTLHPPPKYREKPESKRWDAAVERVERRCGVWNRRRWCCCLVVTAVILVILGVALGVGVGVGLKKKQNSKDDAQKPDPSFPAGSYTFNTTLRETNTSCTTNPSTWRCFPYSNGTPAPFFWIINEVNTTAYTISSTDNPFAPTFTELPLTKHDDGERWTFSFVMNKTVVPSEALTSDNKAAKCTFEETVLEATLRAKGAEGGNGEKFGAWPGDVEIVQRKSPGEGEQKCVESSGEVIGDVGVGEGVCECVYASFDTE